MNKSQLHGKLGQSGKGLRGALAGMLGAMLLCIPVPALACTLYAAQGTAVADGGTIAAKNRDWRPQEQSLHLAEPRQPGGYRYYGLYGGPFERHQLRGGVNEAGLVAYSAAVSSVTKKQKAAAAEAHPPVQGTLRKVLERYATVEEAVQHPELFQGVRFVMLADRSEVAWIEGGLNGEVRIERRQNGVLAHTNHYLSTDLAAQNEKYYESSHKRYDRVMELLQAQKQYTLADFIRIGEDQTTGPVNSLWRTGDETSHTQTVAQMVVWLRPDGDFTVYVKYRAAADAAGHEQTVRLTKQEIFDSTAHQ